jgi:hypothetical protein
MSGLSGRRSELTDTRNEIVPAGERLPTEDAIREALDRIRSDKRKRSARFILAALSSIPWVGGLLSASAALNAELAQGRVNDLQRQWIEEHGRKLSELANTIGEVADRVEGLGPEAQKRIETEGYLGLVRKGFGVWDRADTAEKRDLIRRLLSNAAGTGLAADDLVRLFIEWVDQYHEIHFAVIRSIFRNPGSTRAEIWEDVYGREVREDSAEADLFKLLIRDLSMGSVIRQHRETTEDGRFLRSPRTHARPGGSSRVMKSAFDNKERYELTELGKQFVHYVLSDVVPRLGGDSGAGSSQAMPTPPGATP